MARGRRKRRVAIVTGTRAEYGLLQSTLEALRADRRVELQLIVTGMHLLPRFGHTIHNIIDDGWRIDARVPMQRGNDDPRDQADGLARGVAGIARFVHAADTDVVVVLGDRIEALAGALAAVTSGCVLGHIHGGDVAPGDLDDSLRHAITKLAHVHFAATAQAARRIRRLGEESARIHQVGAVGLDRLRELLDESPHPRKRSGEALVVYHAWGRSPQVDEARHDQHSARGQTGRPAPRDTVSQHRSRAWRRAGSDRRTSSQLRQRRSQRAAIFAAATSICRRLISANVLIGNSSSGVIEAPLAGTPSVNVGGRQAGRQTSGHSVNRVWRNPRCDRRRPGPRRAHATEPWIQQYSRHRPGWPSHLLTFWRPCRLPPRPHARSLLTDGHDGWRDAGGGFTPVRSNRPARAGADRSNWPTRRCVALARPDRRYRAHARTFPHRDRPAPRESGARRG